MQAGASALADGFTSAIEGFASKPIEGAERDGAVGFVKGMGKGFVGCVITSLQASPDLQTTDKAGHRRL